MQQNDYYVEDYTIETCGECEEEIVVYTSGVTYCPHCGKINSPCNICEHRDCINCEFIDSSGNVQPGIEVREISKEEAIWYANLLLERGLISNYYERILTTFDN